jgi:hypothetical protein
MHSSESGLQSAIVKDLRKAGAYVNKNHGGPNSQGRPDLEGVYRGIHFLLEVKLPKNKKGATENQKRHIRQAREAGSVAHIVRSRRAAMNCLKLIDRMVDGAP